MEKTKLRRMRLDEMSNVMDVIEERFQEMYIGGRVEVSCSDPLVQALFDQLVNNCSGLVDIMSYIGAGRIERSKSNFDITIGDETFHIKNITAYNGAGKSNNIIRTYASGGVRDDYQTNQSFFDFRAVKEGIGSTPTSFSILTSMSQRDALQAVLGSSGCTGGNSSDNGAYS